MPAFFVPFMEACEVEAAYESFLRKAGLFAIPSRAERIHSLIFTHNGEAWLAEVGKRLRGRRQGEISVGGRPMYRECETSDSAVVLAILPGNPYVVITDGGLAEGRPARWSSQFKVSRPVHVVRFEGGGESTTPLHQHAARKELLTLARSADGGDSKAA